MKTYERQPGETGIGGGFSAENNHKAVTKPVIELPKPGIGLDEFATNLAKMLPEGALYLYGSDIIEIDRQVATMDQVRFRTWITHHVTPGYTKKVKNTGCYEFLTDTLTESDSKAVLASDHLRQSLPKVSRIINFPMPMMHEGEIVIPKVGYNAETETYLLPGAPEINYSMPLDETKDIILNKVLGGFCFKVDDEGQSKVHAIARILTPYFRGIIGGLSPFWNFKANRPRAGKDYLAQVAHLIYSGKAREDAALPEHDPKGYDKSDETKKRITSYFVEGRNFIHFANCSGYVDDKYFIQLITAPEWSDRILGKSQTRSWNNETDVSISGNMDLALKPDIEPRSRHIILEYFDEDENSRTFPMPDLHEWILTHRGMILSAIHAVYRHWMESGQPNGKTPFTSFQRWARVIGGVMTCPGIEFGDPCQKHPHEHRNEDPELAAMAALYRHCREIDVNNGDLNGCWWTGQEVFDQIERGVSNGDEHIEAFGYFADYFAGRDGKLNRAKTGKQVRKFKSRSINGITMEIDDRDQNSARHRFRFIPK
jgi:hypothetical protein